MHLDPPAPPPSRTLLVALLLALAGSGVAWRCVAGSIAATNAHDDPFAAFCTPAPAAAVVPDDLSADRIVDVTVPHATPDVAVLDERVAHPVSLRRNDVVELDVRTSRPGALAVHGLSGLVRIEAGGDAKVRLRAIHSGRFPLHFHGVDQSHFEIAVLEVRD